MLPETAFYCSHGKERIAIYRGENFFQKPRSHLRDLGVTKDTWSKYSSEEQKMLEATVKPSVAYVHLASVFCESLSCY
jgi:hypothetical protein